MSVAASISVSTADRDLLVVAIPGCVARRQSLTISSPEGFKNAGRALSEFDSCGQWLWGDYLLHAEKFGLSTVLDNRLPNLHTSRINSFVRVARFFAVESRHPLLSFTHHEAVVDHFGQEGAPANARKWLARAAAKDWTVGELREAMRSEKRRGEGDPGPMRGVIRITDFVKVSRYCQTVRVDDFPPEEVAEIRKATAPLYDFLVQVHSAKFGVPA